jgi:hypothetical protein
MKQPEKHPTRRTRIGCKCDTNEAESAGLGLIIYAVVLVREDVVDMGIRCESVGAVGAFEMRLRLPRAYQWVGVRGVAPQQS